MYGEGRLGGTRVVLAKPETFMNNSGWAVGDLLKWYKPQHDELIVIYDDIDLPCGALRIRMNGSAAVALCHVAAGRLDGWLEKYIGRYDYMAGAIIVEEAGGKVTNFAGDVAYTTGDNIVATNGIIQQELLEQIKKTGVELPNVKKK